jgi:hypothetical protein
MRPSPIPLYIALGLIALVVIAKPIAAWEKHDLEHGAPRAEFFSKDAWQHCEAMADEAKALGAEYWTCHDPDTTKPTDEDSKS